MKRPPPLRAALARVLAAALAGGGAGCLGDDDAAATDASLAEAAGDAGSDAGACAPTALDAAMVDGCADLVRFPCGLPPDAMAQGCEPRADFCVAQCPSIRFFTCDLYAGCVDGAVAPGPVVLSCDKCLGDLGRRPRGLAPAAGGGAVRSPGAYFAEAARLEGASVRAFRDLARHLETLGAPRRLRARCARAARDERRHALSTRRLARRFGAQAERPRVAPFTPVTLEALVTDNAVAGCVKETFAALVAMHQAALARDPDVARPLARIAQDETRHAALAWAVHRWGMAHLPPVARARVGVAMDRTARALVADAAVPWPPSVAEVTGLPGVDVARRLARAFAADVIRLPPAEGSNTSAQPGSRGAVLCLLVAAPCR